MVNINPTYKKISISDTTNENIIGMQEDKVKSFIVSINGEGITIDHLVKSSEDFPILDAIVQKVKTQAAKNDTILSEKINNQP